MAVELRCPDCRAKLRLKLAPEAGTEVECPKCGTVFPAPEPEIEADEDAPKKKKKKPAADNDNDNDDSSDEKATATKKKSKKAKKPVADGTPGAPRRRKAKKRETSKVALIGVICTGLLLLCTTAGVLIWFFTRTSKSVEMMYYIPADSDHASGLNLGHAQKYPEFYKSIAATFKDTEFKAAGDAIAKAAGLGDIDSLVDYVVFGSSAKNGGATVFRTKEEFDASALGKLPGAKEVSNDGPTYYLVDDFKNGASGGQVRVFSPTNRLIVFCSTSVPAAVFKQMRNGNIDNREQTLGVRMGPLGKRVTRGTFWALTVYDEKNKPPEPPPEKKEASPGGGAAGSDDAAAQFARMSAETLGSAQGVGFKASIGSREVRFELIVWCKDGERASNMSTKWKESELGKGDDGTPPKWWKDQTTALGSKKIAAQLAANLGFGSSGELFYARSTVDTADLKDAVSSFATRATGKQNGGAQMPPPAGGGPQPPPRPPGMPRRRRVWVSG